MPTYIAPNDFDYVFHPGNAREIEKENDWFKDKEGRYILFRGVNFGSRSKLPPYLPVLDLGKSLSGNLTDDLQKIEDELSEVGDRLDLLRLWGFNIVRLLVMWKAIEPTLNANLGTLLPEGQYYLACITNVIDSLYKRGLFVFIDFHQDLAHECYGGDGFPDWAIAVDPQPNPPDPTPYWTTGYLLNPSLRNTLDSFWNDSLQNETVPIKNYKVRSNLEKTIYATARHFMSLYGGTGHPAILGYELFNEPHHANTNEDTFETYTLPIFYNNVSREIRRSDTRAFIFIEPRVTWTLLTTTPKTKLATSKIADPRMVFSFHFYDSWTVAKSLVIPPIPDVMSNKVKEWPVVFKLMREGASSDMELIPFLTEFGGSQDWDYWSIEDSDLPTVYEKKQIRAYMDLQFQQIERELLNATYWNYDLYNTVNGKDNWNFENFSLLGPNRIPRNIDIVARPYPMRSSAKPSTLYFNVENRYCFIELEGNPVQEPSVIYIPQTVHYPLGFDVYSTSQYLHWDQVQELLYWIPNPLPNPDNSPNLLVICPLEEKGLNKDKFPTNIQVKIKDFRDHLKYLLPVLPVNERLIGNKKTRELHRSICPWLDYIKPIHQQEYKHIKDALDEGFDGCYYCFPEFHIR